MDKVTRVVGKTERSPRKETKVDTDRSWFAHLHTCRDDADRGIEQSGGVATTAAWKAVQIEAWTKAELRTDTETDIEMHIKAETGPDISVNTDRRMGDSPIMNPKESGQTSSSSDNRFEVGRQMRNLKQWPEHATPQ